MSIDIGIKNLGIVWGKCDRFYQKKPKFYKFALIDLTKVEVEKKTGIQQYNHLTDKLHTFFKVLNPKIFDGAKVIFVEYQPPKGLRIIQEWFIRNYEERVRFVNPKTMHKHFGIQKKNYEERKIRVCKKSVRYMTIDFFSNWLLLERKHDISDAICLSVAFMSKHSKAFTDLHLF